MTKSKLTLLSLLLVALISMLTWSQPSTSAQAALPANSDTDDIKAVLKEAYHQLAIAAETYDVSGFPSVFVDTADFPLTDQQKSEVRGVLGAKGAGEFGYLTAMQAKFISQGLGADLAKAAIDKAAQENRTLTVEELQALVKANHGQLPPSEIVDNPNDSIELVYQSIDIKGDRASVVYDDGAALQRAILVRINGHWLIASIKPIQIHF